MDDWWLTTSNGLKKEKEKTNEEQLKTTRCLGEDCPGEGDLQEGPGFMWGSKQNGETMRKRKTVMRQKSNKIKEMTAGVVRLFILQKMT